MREAEKVSTYPCCLLIAGHGTKTGVGKIRTYMQSTAWEHKVRKMPSGSRSWIQVFTRSHIEGIMNYLKELQHLCQGEHASHLSLALMVNMAIGAERILFMSETVVHTFYTSSPPLLCVILRKR